VRNRLVFSEKHFEFDKPMISLRFVFDLNSPFSISAFGFFAAPD
jgi:hypothetical protein